MEKESAPIEKIWLGPISKVLDFKAYTRTRKAVKSGDELALCSQTELEEKGYLKPWPFNIQESVYAASPAIISTFILDFLYGKPEARLTFPDGTSDRDKLFSENLLGVIGFFDKLSVPILTTLVVFLIGWGSIKKSDFTPALRKKALNSYLYYDGAYGLLPQALIVLCISLLGWASVRPQWSESIPEIIPIGMLIIFYISSIALFILIARTIPKRLFKQLGYSSRVRHFWNKSLPGDPPWSKYTLAIFLGGWPLIGLWLIAMYAISYGIAFIGTELKLLFI